MPEAREEDKRKISHGLGATLGDHDVQHREDGRQHELAEVEEVGEGTRARARRKLLLLLRNQGGKERVRVNWPRGGEEEEEERMGKGRGDMLENDLIAETIL